MRYIFMCIAPITLIDVYLNIVGSPQRSVEGPRLTGSCRYSLHILSIQNRRGDRHYIQTRFIYDGNVYKE